MPRRLVEKTKPTPASTYIKENNDNKPMKSIIPLSNTEARVQWRWLKPNYEIPIQTAGVFRNWLG
jgi:hypothetical protein